MFRSNATQDSLRRKIMEQAKAKQVPHVLIFPFPAQGHINSMLPLAKLLSLAGFNITFLNTDYNHRRLFHHVDLDAWTAQWPGFRFRTISDGLPSDYPRSAEKVIDLYESLKVNTKPLLCDMLISDRCWGSDHPINCIIGDGIATFTIDVAEKIGVPAIIYRTASPTSFWSYASVPKLVELGELPFTDEPNMDEEIKGVAGMETLLRRRDLPSPFRAKQLGDQTLQLLYQETVNATRASGLIFNSFEHLDSISLPHIRAHFPTTYTIGPIHSLLRTRLTDSAGSFTFWKKDETCLTWLDTQQPKSVIYVSFGSLAVLSRDELLEFWHGLVNSRQPFLWVMRQDLVNGKGDVGQIPEELVEATGDRGCLVEWAPQEEVLAHPAVGGFLTHSGWNSTMESVSAGVPMICRPFNVDQQINSRFVEKVWGLGLELTENCSRDRVEKTVRELMEKRKEEFQKSAEKMAGLVKEAIGKGGSSYMNLEKLIQEIRAMRC